MKKEKQKNNTTFSGNGSLIWYFNFDKQNVIEIIFE